MTARKNITWERGNDFIFPLILRLVLGRKSRLDFFLNGDGEENQDFKKFGMWKNT